MIMASDENVNRDSCIYDPNFAIVCSFFDKFSSLCGIKHPSFSDLQTMLDSTDEISPELIDLHVRLMRKAKKNVNPDRWQRTLAKFCYFYSPQDSWDLEQHGYKELDFKQRLKLLLCVCEAQFDHNVKFKTDINKLPIDDLRLSPIGIDKDGIKYWIHTDEKLNLKVYKENPEEETFDLIATDRDSFVKLIEALKTESDPTRKIEEPPSEEDTEDEELEEEEIDDSDIKDEPNADEKNSDEVPNESTEKESQPETVSDEKPTPEPIVEQLPVKDTLNPAAPKIEETSEYKPKKHTDVKTKRFEKTPEIKLKKDKVVVDNTPKSIKAEEFAQHIEKLKSEKILLPLLNSPLPFKDPPKSNGNESLKTKINMKFNMIKPVLQNEMIMSKIEDAKKSKEFYKKVVVKRDDNAVSNYVMQINKSKEAAKVGKPGLKLEQILKSKLAQKLAANEPKEGTSTEPVDQKAKTETPVESTNEPVPIRPIKGTLSERLSPVDNEPVKRKLSSEDVPSKKSKLDDEDEREIEEPLMLVTGVGSGKDCECGNPDDSDEEDEFVLFITGVGSGRDCDTGNNENEETDKDKHATLTHKVEDILSKDIDGDQAASTSDESKNECEKKKPKLWTIDAICNSDSKDNSKKEDISCFPNYSFNKDKKPDSIPYRNEYSYFGTPVESKENDIIPTNFYFGCDTQNPPYVAEVRNVNSFKPTKSHNVKDIVELDGNDSNYNSNNNEAFNLCTRESTPPKQTSEAINYAKSSENVYSNVMNLSANTNDVNQKTQSKIANDCAISNNFSSIVPYDDSDEESDTENGNSSEETSTVMPNETLKEPEKAPESAKEQPTPLENSIHSEERKSEPIEESKPVKNLPLVEPSQNNTQVEIPPEEVTPKSDTLPCDVPVEEESPKIEPTDPVHQPVEPSIGEPVSEKLEKPSSPEKQPQLPESPKETEKPDLASEPQPLAEVHENLNITEERKSVLIVEKDPKSEPLVEEAPLPEIYSPDPSPEPFEEEEPPFEMPIVEEKPPIETPVVEEKPFEVPPQQPREPETAPEPSKVEESSPPKVEEPIEPEQKDIHGDETPVSEPNKEPNLVENLPEKSTIEESAPLVEFQPLPSNESISERQPEPPTDEVPIKADSPLQPEPELKQVVTEPKKSQEPEKLEIETPSEESKPQSKPEQIIEQIPKENEESDESVKIENQHSEKKPKKGKPSEESTPPLVLRTSARVTRSAKKEVTPKKEDDKKKPKETKPEKQTPKESKNKKLKSKNQTTKSEEETETPKTAKKLKGKKKAAKAAKPVAKTPTKTESEGSSDDNESDEENDQEADEETDKEPKPKISAKQKKSIKKSDDEEDEESNDKPEEDEKKSEKPTKTTLTKKKPFKRGWLNEIDISNITPSSSPGIRQSRRIAQLKIKEQAEGKYIDHVTPSKKTSKADSKSKQTSSKKNNKTPTKKSSKTKIMREDSDGEDSNYERSMSKKKRKKKDQKKKFNLGKPWKAGSDSSTEEEAEEEDHFEEDEEDEEIVLHDASDHEFSPESDVDDEDFVPVKRARTAHSKPKTEDKTRDDLCCQKCRTAELPEWILLCDKCDEGWHAACLRPPLLSIPEGDWYCPPCQHNMLISSLHKFLKSYDKDVKKRDNEELRRKRLEYVGISFSNIISEQQKIEEESKKDEEFVKYELSDDNSEDESEEEPLYTLRVRRQANVSYRLNEYDELMNSAIQRDANGEVCEEVEPAVPEIEPKPVEEVAEKVVEEKEENEEDEKDEEESSSEQENPKEEKVSPMILQLRGIRKKPARLTKLDVSSDDDHYSDEDFKGTSGEEYDDDEYGKSETDSDAGRYRKSKRGPVRRSTRARVTRYDNDFINDDDSDEDEYEPKKKKKRSRNSDSDSEEEDSTWGKRKRSKYSRAHRTSSSKKKRRRIVFNGDSDEEKKERKDKKGKKSRVTYGLEESEDDYPQRRTRGKKINYLENLGTDSDEENSKSKTKKVKSDDDDYVNEDDERNSGENAVNENGNKNEDGSKPSDVSNTSLHELIATNNTSVIRTYSKSSNAENQRSQQAKSDSMPETDDLDTNDVAGEKGKKSKKSPKKDVQMYSGVVKDDNKLILKKIDTNPSLEGMQSMAQSIPQMISTPSNYSVAVAHQMVPMAGDGPFPPNIGPPGKPTFSEVGIAYEDGEMPPMAVDGDKYPHPIRVVSPSRLYGPDGQPLPPQMVGRPPYVMGPMPPGIPPNMMPRGPIPPMHLRGPPPAMPPMSQPPVPPNVTVSSPNTMMEQESLKRRARGRGKKQLEIERIKRDSVIPTSRKDEMIPLHLLKPLPNDMNAPRPPSYNSPSPPSSFANYANMPRLPYSTVGPPPPPTQSAVTVSVGNSKRVKITPTRMRMPTPQNVMRFPRTPPMMHGSPLPLDPSPSGGAAVLVNNGDNPQPPPGTSPSAGETPIKKEAGPEQYYQPPPYPPASQIPRGFNQRPEFSFVQKPLPPPMYQQPIPSTGAPTVIRPHTVTTNTVISGPIPSQGTPPLSKPETPVSTAPYSTPYPPSQPIISSPTSKANSTPSQPVPVVAGPPTTAYQALHIKQIPVPSSAPAAPFNPPYYAAAPIVPNSYPPQSQPRTYGPPPVVSTLTQAFPGARIPPPHPSFVKSPQPATYTTPPETTSATSSSEYVPPPGPASTEGFQYPPVTSSGDGPQFQADNYEEESAAPPEEQPSGEFGGLVSYFSSQREDDLDA